MIDELDDDEYQVLAGARRAFSPSDADAERVLLATQVALASGMIASTAQPAAKWLAGGVMKLMAAVTMASVVSGGVGFYLGARSVAPAAAPPSTVHSHAVSAVAPALPVRLALPAPVRVRVANTVPDDSAAPVPQSAPTRPLVGARMIVTSAKVPAAAAVAPVALTEKLEPLSPDSLQQEITVLRRVEVALRRQDAKLAVTLLDELDRTVPEGKLGEERLAAFVMARCLLGLGSRAGLIDEFARAHPQSVYLPRVQQSCAAKAPPFTTQR